MGGGRSSDRVQRSALFGLFFLSGVAALIYQTARHRLLGLFAGADTIAAALVVGAFLLGLGIGSLAAGLYADRLSRRASLLAFALCEVGIALFAVVSPWLYYDVIYRELLPLSSSRAVIFAIVFAGLLWPTFLMGCSLPFLSKAIVRQIAGSAQLIGGCTVSTPWEPASVPSSAAGCEIVAPVIETLHQYEQAGGRSGVDRLFSNRKFEIVVADGRHELALDKGVYDVIEADAILPKTALSGLLNSQEFFRQVRGKLAPGGIYVQWAPTQRSVEPFRSIFPYIRVVHPAMLGSDRPIPYSRDKMLALLQRPEIAAHFAGTQVDVQELRRWFADKKAEPLNEGRVTPAHSPNTDFFPRDEYYLNRP